MTVVDPDLARRLAAQGDVPDALPVPATPCPVSERELQVLVLVAEGVSSHAIASELGIAHATVRSVLQRAFNRTGVPSRCGLVAQLFRSGHLRWVAGRVQVDLDPPPRLFWLAGRPMLVTDAERAVEALRGPRRAA